MCRSVGGGWVDVWLDVSVGGWFLGGCFGRCVVVGWMYVWNCRKWEVFGWMCGRMCR